MNKKRFNNIIHPFNPIYNAESKILILGSFPSIKSRENDYYYGNMRNRFWEIISTLYGEQFPKTIKDKEILLLNHHIALYDVIYSCDIIKSYDSSIENVVPSNLSSIIKNSKIDNIYTNGNKAHDLYQKYLKEELMINDFKLPSTSPANARYTLDMLMESWSLIKDRR